MAKGQVEGEKGDRFEWNFCDGIDLPGSDCNRAFVCRTLNNGTQKSFGTKTQLKEASDSCLVFSSFYLLLFSRLIKRRDYFLSQFNFERIG